MIPQRAIQEEIEGTVRAEISIKNGAVADVRIVSGPSVYHAAVKNAIMQYRCLNTGDVVATQEFEFRF